MKADPASKRGAIPNRIRSRAAAVLLALVGAPWTMASLPSTPPALPDDPACTEEDRIHIARTYVLARESTAAGNGGHGALLLKDGKVVLEFASATNTTGDVTQHAETGVIALASRTFGKQVFEGAILYTSEEPCIMCMGSVRAAGLKAFVYGTTTRQVRQIGGRKAPENMLESREVFERLEYPIVIRGPLMEAEGLQILAELRALREAAAGATRTP